MKTLLLLLTLSLPTLTAPLAANAQVQAPAKPALFAAQSAPSALLISEDRRHVVVFDAGRASGDAFAISLYMRGKRIKTLSLEDFLSEVELAQIPQCRCLKSHRAWRSLYVAQLLGPDLVLSHADGTKILISLETGMVRR